MGGPRGCGYTGADSVCGRLYEKRGSERCSPVALGKWNRWTGVGAFLVRRLFMTMTQVSKTLARKEWYSLRISENVAHSIVAVKYEDYEA
jgi:hypothetical protein